MKIEKLTENKIRIVLNLDDLKSNCLDSNSILNNTPESQNLILSLLNKAETEVGFYTKDCKLLIESFSLPEGDFIFTITKFVSSSQKSNRILHYNNSSHSKPIINKKAIKTTNKSIIYSFETFDNFCEFCTAFESEIFHFDDLKQLATNSSLFIYNNTYFLVISGINPNNIHINTLLSIASEFGNKVSPHNNLEAKLLEHGKLIFKKAAIIKTINIFIKRK